MAVFLLLCLLFMNRVDYVINPISAGYSWFYEQYIYDPKGIARALKSSEGSGNMPKIVLIIETN